MSCLYLVRKRGQRIRIGKNVSVSFTGLQGDSVIFAIEAPKCISVHREEIYQAMKNGVELNPDDIKVLTKYPLKIGLNVKSRQSI